MSPWRAGGLLALAVGISGAAGCSSSDAGSTDAGAPGGAEAAQGTGGGSGGTSGAGASSGSAGGAAAAFEVGATWQWQLSDLPVDTSFEVDVYDVDLFETGASWIAARRAEGRRVICYFSAGSFESYRPDSDDFPAAAKGKELDGWPGERWIDVRSEAVRGIMKARLDLARDKGCDAVEPDNVDGYANDNGLGLTGADQLDFNRFIADEAHARGLSVGLKNDLEQLGALVDHFDWALNEECFSYHECGAYRDTFIAAGKAVFHAEYLPEGKLEQVCAATVPLGLSTILKRLDLDAWRVACP
jgi:hypothetical protein